MTKPEFRVRILDGPFTNFVGMKLHHRQHKQSSWKWAFKVARCLLRPTAIG